MLRRLLFRITPSTPLVLCGQIVLAWMVGVVLLHVASFYDLLTWGEVADMSGWSLFVVVVVTFDIFLLQLIGPLFARRRK